MIKRFNTISIISPARFIWRGKIPRITNTVSVSGLILFNLKTYYKTTVIKTVWYWFKKRRKERKKNTNRSVEQNREPRNRPTQIYPYCGYSEEK